MFRGISVAAAVAAFLLAVLGSWVRINGAGMTCPDWPLCHHELIPALHGGVVLEWSHRLVAFLDGFLVLGALWSGWRERKRIAGIRPVMGFIGCVFLVQVCLGGLTVALSNSPWSVVVHWGTGMLFLAGLTALAVLAVVQPKEIAIRHSLLGGLVSASVVLAFATMCAGAFVSSSNDGLACTTIPTCDGGSWIGDTPGQVAMMIHRLIAIGFLIVATLGAYAASLGTTVRVRTAVLLGYALVVLQAMLGLANVVWRLPTMLREAHAANAGLTFLAFVVALVFAAIDGTVPSLARAGATAGTTPVREGAR
jgi:heme a synthase